MIWLSWRQFRTAAAVTFGALAVVAVVVLVTGLQLHATYHSAATCTPGPECDTIRNAFLSRFQVLQPLLEMVGLLLLPAVMGVFWAAPLVARELETGTYRLAWTQGVTRTRWLTTKLVLVGAASVLATGLLSLMVTWWSTPLDLVGANRFQPSLFQVRDVVPLGYAAFAFALGAAAGLLTRRTLPAMAVTLVGYITVRVAEMVWIRPHFMAPMTYTSPVETVAGGGIKLRAPAGWVISEVFTDPSGQSLHNLRVSPDSPCFATRSCFAGYHHTITYQPAARYWPFQWYETGLFVALAAGLIALSYWWLRRRLN